MLLLLGKYFIGITAYLGHLALNKRQIQISNRQAAFAQRLVEKSARLLYETLREREASRWRSLS
ncbi:MAG: hypothetical protein V7K65_05230 [Nostoc sp.]